MFFDQNSLEKKEIFLFSKVSRLALEPTQRPIQWAPWITRPERGGDPSPPSSTEVQS
jgi:hypothetical protein